MSGLQLEKDAWQEERQWRELGRILFRVLMLSKLYLVDLNE